RKVLMLLRRGVSTRSIPIVAADQAAGAPLHPSQATPHCLCKYATLPSVGLTVETFIAKWQGAEGGQERANYALFLTELCTRLVFPTPDPASAVSEHNDYVFERAVTFHNADGTTSQGRIDLYKRGSFVLE